MNERSPQDACNAVLSQNPTNVIVLGISPGVLHCEWSKPMGLSDILLLELHLKRTINKMMDELQKPQNVLPIQPE